MKDYIRLIYKMSRSTPLSNLPSRESTQAYDQKENELVKEILQEIDIEAEIEAHKCLDDFNKKD